jgi:hypothetical protein
MQPEWWEGIARFINDYWWVFLILLVLALAAYFSRNLWLPLLIF